MSCCVFFFQAEDGIRDLVRSRGLGDVYKRQALAYGMEPKKVDGMNAIEVYDATKAAIAAIHEGLSLIHI